jgi:hypothetical protein
MAKAGKGKEGASRVTWRVPSAEEINPGDILQFYSPENSFQFRVLSLQHGGEWVFGFDTRDPEGSKTGPIAVKRSDCMTPETAARVLKDLPTINLDAPQPTLEV